MVQLSISSNVKSIFRVGSSKLIVRDVNTLVELVRLICNKNWQFQKDSMLFIVNQKETDISAKI